MTDRDDVRRLMGQLGTPVEVYQVFNDQPQSASLSRWTLLEGVSKASRGDRAPLNEARAEDIGPHMSELIAHLVRSSSPEKEAGTGKETSLKAGSPDVLPSTKPGPLLADTEYPVRHESASFGMLFRRPQPASERVEASSPVSTGDSLKHLLKKIGA